MASNRTSQASHFFKVVFSPVDRGIRIPTEFVRKHGDSLDKVVYLNVPNGASWPVELLQTDDGTWLDKGWREFSEYYSIKQCHFLVFRYDGKSHFHVIIFDPSASEIEYPIESTDSKRSKSRVRKLDEVVRSDDDPVEILEEINPAASFQKKNKLRKSRNQEDQTEKETEKQNLEKLREDVKKEESSEDTWVPTRQATNTSSSKAVYEKRKFAAYQRAKAFTSTNPFFISFMQPSYVRGFNLNVSLTFARKYFTKDKSCDFELRVSEGTKIWPVKSHFNTAPPSAKLYHGWLDFARDNNLVVGDVCVFELRFPPLFGRTYEHMLPERALLRTESGKTWSVKIERIEGLYCFTRGWTKFVNDLELELGELLIFWLILEEKNVFEVAVCGTTGCNKFLNSASASHVPVNFEPEVIELNLETTRNQGTKRSRTSHGSGRRKSMKVEKEKRCQGSKISDDSANDGKCFTQNIPLGFAKKTGIINKSQVMLQNKNGASWRVDLKLYSYSCMLFLCKGWPEFRKKNKLTCGNRYAFEYIPETDSIQVQLFKKINRPKCLKKLKKLQSATTSHAPCNISDEPEIIELDFFNTSPAPRAKRPTGTTCGATRRKSKKSANRDGGAKISFTPRRWSFYQAASNIVYQEGWNHMQEERSDAGVSEWVVYQRCTEIQQQMSRGRH
ncbi:hypothetical protein ACH5RR_014112 [Cinchona calisaya]|uniref:TF-B3 domain-containing protein n=1 Tax=Cinchona calisaya TaxID=153742 RepID=A0ABD3A1X9_9GENT